MPMMFSSTDLGLLQLQLSKQRPRQSGRCRLPAEVWDAPAVLTIDSTMDKDSRFTI